MGVLLPSVLKHTIVPSAARTATFDSGVIDVSGYRRITSHLHVTARSGTTPTLNCQYHTSDDSTFPAGQTFNLSGVSVGAHTAYTSGSTIPSMDIIFMEITLAFIRLTCTIAGTTPSWTFRVFLVASGN